MRRSFSTLSQAPDRIDAQFERGAANSKRVGLARYWELVRWLWNPRARHFRVERPVGGLPTGSLWGPVWLSCDCRAGWALEKPSFLELGHWGRVPDSHLRKQKPPEMWCVCVCRVGMSGGWGDGEEWGGGVGRGLCGGLTISPLPPRHGNVPWRPLQVCVGGGLARRKPYWALKELSEVGGKPAARTCQHSGPDARKEGPSWDPPKDPSKSPVGGRVTLKRPLGLVTPEAVQCSRGPFLSPPMSSGGERAERQARRAQCGQNSAPLEFSPGAGRTTPRSKAQGTVGRKK